MLTNTSKSRTVALAAFMPMYIWYMQPVGCLKLFLPHQGCDAHKFVSSGVWFQGAIASMGRSAASTYAKHNIRVNIVSPGLVRGLFEMKSDCKLAVVPHFIARHMLV